MKVDNKVRKRLKAIAKEIGTFKWLLPVNVEVYVEENGKEVKKEIRKMQWSEEYGAEIPVVEEKIVSHKNHYYNLLREWSADGEAGIAYYRAQCDEQIKNFIDRHGLNDMTEAELKKFVLDELS